MPRFTLLTLGMVATLLVAVPPAGAATAPRTLQAIVKKLTAAERGACTSTAYRAPLAGFLDVRLRGRGDWDLQVRDAAGAVLASSRAFGGREVAQTWVRAGQRVTARGCRGRGAGPSARTTFRLAAVAVPRLTAGTAQLLRVYGTERRLHALEAAGLDVTHAHGRDWADVIVSGATQLATVVASGLRHTVRIADLSRSLQSARAADRRNATRGGRLRPADRAHDVPHLRRGPDRAQGARRRATPGSCARSSSAPPTRAARSPASRSPATSRTTTGGPCTSSWRCTMPASGRRWRPRWSSPTCSWPSRRTRASPTCSRASAS